MRKKKLKRNCRYGIVGRNENDIYWTLEKVSNSAFIANLWRLFYYLFYNEVEVREHVW